jgi:hypothetical protein
LSRKGPRRKHRLLLRLHRKGVAVHVEVCVE